MSNDHDDVRDAVMPRQTMMSPQSKSSSLPSHIDALESILASLVIHNHEILTDNIHTRRGGTNTTSSAAATHNNSD